MNKLSQNIKNKNMKKEVTTLEPVSGILVGPEGLQLEGLSTKKQKQIAISFIIETQQAIANLIASVEKKKDQVKKINEQLTKIEPIKKLKILNKEINEEKFQAKELASRYMGGLEVLKRLGIDLSKELQNIKRLEQ